MDAYGTGLGSGGATRRSAANNDRAIDIRICGSYRRTNEPRGRGTRPIVGRSKHGLHQRRLCKSRKSLRTIGCPRIEFGQTLLQSGQCLFQGGAVEPFDSFLSAGPAARPRQCRCALQSERRRSPHERQHRTDSRIFPHGMVPEHPTDDGLHRMEHPVAYSTGLRIGGSDCSICCLNGSRYAKQDSTDPLQQPWYSY